jgi:hypothetical protein
MTRFTSAAIIALAFGLASPAFAQPPAATVGTNASTIDQINSGNSATVSQSVAGGAGNTSEINQKGGDVANITQIGTGGTLNYSKVEQQGNNQYSNGLTGAVAGASVYQEGNYNWNESTVKQKGSGGNTASIWQHGNSNWNISTVDQDGAHNAAAINQSGNWATNESNVSQTGNYNNASVTQN